MGSVTFTLWVDNHTEGWHPYECETLEGCFAQAMECCTSMGSFRITRDVDFEIREVRAGGMVAPPGGVYIREGDPVPGGALFPGDPMGGCTCGPSSIGPGSRGCPLHDPR